LLGFQHARSHLKSQRFSAAAKFLAVTAAPLKRLGSKVIISEKILLGTTAVYFWLGNCLMALARISGPLRPDSILSNLRHVIVPN